MSRARAKEVIESRSKDSDTIIEVNLPIDSCPGRSTIDAKCRHLVNNEINTQSCFGVIEIAQIILNKPQFSSENQRSL